MLQSGPLYLYQGSSPTLAAVLGLVVDSNGDINVGGSLYGNSQGQLTKKAAKEAWIEAIQ